MKPFVFIAGLLVNVTSVVFLISCQQQNKQEVLDVNNPTFGWVGETRFNVSFEQEGRVGATIIKNIYNKRLIDVILDEVFSGRRPAYYPSSLENDGQSATPIPLEEIKKIGWGVDSVFVFDPTTGKETLEVVERTLNYDEVRQLRVWEEWYFDEKAFRLHTRVKAIGPIWSRYDEEGQYVGDILLFWVKMEE